MKSPRESKKRILAIIATFILLSSVATKVYAAGSVTHTGMVDFITDADDSGVTTDSYVVLDLTWLNEALVPSVGEATVEFRPDFFNTMTLTFYDNAQDMNELISITDTPLYGTVYPTGHFTNGILDSFSLNYFLATITGMPGTSDLEMAARISGDILAGDLQLSFEIINELDDNGDWFTGYLNLRPRPSTPCDFNADDTEDILVRDTITGAMTLYEIDASQANIVLAETSAGSYSTVWSIPGINDCGNDGKADILLRHDNGVIYLRQMDGYTQLDLAKVSDLSTGWDVAGLVDFGGDGKADILLRHPLFGHMYLWPLDGSSKVLAESGLVGGLAVADPLVPGSGWYIAGLADFGGDGKADILVRHNGTGNMYMWQMDGYTKQVDPRTGTIGASAGGLILAYEIVGVADFNGDRKADILARNGNFLWIWEMNGTERIRGYSPGGGLTSVLDIVHVGDSGGDDRADILVRNTTTGALTLHEMDPDTGLFQAGVAVDTLGSTLEVQ
jgi:hypothetical protein